MIKFLKKHWKLLLIIILFIFTIWLFNPFEKQVIEPKRGNHSVNLQELNVYNTKNVLKSVVDVPFNLKLYKLCSKFDISHYKIERIEGDFDDPNYEENEDGWCRRGININENITVWFGDFKTNRIDYEKAEKEHDEGYEIYAKPETLALWIRIFLYWLFLIGIILLINEMIKFVKKD